MACITKFCPLCRIRSAVAHLSFWAELAAEAPAIDQRLAGVGPRYVLCRVEEATLTEQSQKQYEEQNELNNVYELVCGSLNKGVRDQEGKVREACCVLATIQTCNVRNSQPAAKNHGLHDCLPQPSLAGKICIHVLDSSACTVRLGRHASAGGGAVAARRPGDAGAGGKGDARCSWQEGRARGKRETGSCIINYP